MVTERSHFYAREDADTLFALDLDRTLLKTSAVAEAFKKYVATTNAEASRQLGYSQEALEKTGGSVDMLAVLARAMGSPALRQCTDGFVDSHRDRDYLEQGARELLSAVESHGQRVGIVTYGGREWQEAKLALVGFSNPGAEVPRLIRDEKGGKGALIASWYSPETGLYHLPIELGGGTVAKVVLVDDKPIELEGLPDNASAYGYLYTGGTQPATGQLPVTAESQLPANVIVVNSLDEVIRKEGL